MKCTICMVGTIIKEARLHVDMTRKELAAKVNITPRHLMSIEQGKKKPSFDLLYSLIHELFIPADQIFHPETAHDHKEFDKAITLLRGCNDKELDVIVFIIKAVRSLRSDQ